MRPESEISNMCLSDGMEATAVFSGGDVTLEGCRIDMGTKTSVTSRAILSYGPLSVIDCEVDLNETLYTAAHTVIGIIGHGETVIRNSSVTVSGTGSSTGVGGIHLSSDGSALTGEIYGNTVTIGTSYTSPYIAIGIECDGRGNSLSKRTGSTFPRNAWA